jgi:hypothetical protein
MLYRYEVKRPGGSRGLFCFLFSKVKTVKENPYSICEIRFMTRWLKSPRVLKYQENTESWFTELGYHQVQPAVLALQQILSEEESLVLKQMDNLSGKDVIYQDEHQVIIRK